jgi:hypothetical protein
MPFTRLANVNAGTTSGIRVATATLTGYTPQAGHLVVVSATAGSDTAGALYTTGPNSMVTAVAGGISYRKSGLFYRIMTGSEGANPQFTVEQPEPGTGSLGISAIAYSRTGGVTGVSVLGSQIRGDSSITFPFTMNALPTAQNGLVIAVGYLLGSTNFWSPQSARWAEVATHHTYSPQQQYNETVGDGNSFAWIIGLEGDSSTTNMLAIASLDISGTVSPTLSVTLTELDGITPLPSPLSSCRWAWYDANPGLGGAPVTYGTALTITNGVLNLTLTGSTLTNGQFGYLLLEHVASGRRQAYYLQVTV